MWYVLYTKLPNTRVRFSSFAMTNEFRRPINWLLCWPYAAWEAEVRVRATPHTLGTTPRTLGATPRTLGTTPSSVGTTPPALETTPRTLRTTPSILGTTPSTLWLNRKADPYNARDTPYHTITPTKVGNFVVTVGARRVPTSAHPQRNQASTCKLTVAATITSKAVNARRFPRILEVGPQGTRGGSGGTLKHPKSEAVNARRFHRPIASPQEAHRTLEPAPLGCLCVLHRAPGY